MRHRFGIEVKIFRVVELYIHKRQQNNGCVYCAVELDLFSVHFVALALIPKLQNCCQRKKYDILTISLCSVNRFIALNAVGGLVLFIVVLGLLGWLLGLSSCHTGPADRSQISHCGSHLTIW